MNPTEKSISFISCASQHTLGNFEGSDRIAMPVRNRDYGETIQPILSAQKAASPNSGRGRATRTRTARASMLRGIEPGGLFDFVDQCPHPMACAPCGFYRPKDSAAALLFEGKKNLLRLLPGSFKADWFRSNQQRKGGNNAGGIC